MSFFLFVILVLVAIAHWGVDGFVGHKFVPRICEANRSRNGNKLAMALPPIGPLCPFRSSTAIKEESSNAQDESPQEGFAQEFSRIQSSMQLGQTPDPSNLRSVASNMDLAIDKWVKLFGRLLSTPDYQSREYARIVETHLNVHGTSSRSIALLVRWQSSCLRALADGKQQPLPPAQLDLQKMMDETKQESLSSSSDKKPSISAMQAARMVTALPYIEEAFESETIQSEYQELVRDHSVLIEEGSKYGDFEPMEKLSFLDRIEIIENRWESFFLQFEPENTLNQDYVNQCGDYLSCMKLNEDEFRRLVKESHRRMRKDAERERK